MSTPSLTMSFSASRMVYSKLSRHGDADDENFRTPRLSLGIELSSSRWRQPRLVVLHGLGTVSRGYGRGMSRLVVRHDSFSGSAVLYPRPLAVQGSGPPPGSERKAMLLNE